MIDDCSTFRLSPKYFGHVLRPLLSLLLLLVPAHADRTIVSMDGLDLSRVVKNGATLSLTRTAEGTMLDIRIGPDQEWPQAVLKPAEGFFDLSDVSGIEFPVVNTGSGPVTVSLRIDNKGADGKRHCCYGKVSLKAGESGFLSARIARSVPVVNGELKLIGMRGYPGQDEGTVDASRVNQLVIFIGRPDRDHRFLVGDIRGTGTAVPLGAVDARTFFPFIDPFGQYLHKDWPGKTHSLSELEKSRKAEDEALAASTAPGNWDRWGGWASGPRLNATGFFRAEKNGGQWRLVDPDGRLFFSHGVDVVQSNQGTPVSERDGWFQDLPSPNGGFQDCYFDARRVVRGHYQGKRPVCFNFGKANAKRRYGEDWERKFGEAAHARLRAWGLNTIGNWSDEGICLMRRTPYTASVWVNNAKAIEGSEGYWGQFRDVFDPSFRRGLQEGMVRVREKFAGDPWCLGLFIDNELSWGKNGELAQAVLKSPAGQAAKQVWLEDLKKKYGTVDALNRAWDTSYGSWSAWLENREAPKGEGAAKDILEFNQRICEEYFRACREELKRAAPDLLYLGCRFAWANDQAVRAAAKYCDVISYNIYQRSPKTLVLPAGVDMPVLIGEFHFGALDRGMFHTGLVAVGSQEERARAYQEYVTDALGHPNIVGCHWFQYMDEATTGREQDGENYQIGLVDICGTPYPETVQAVRKMGERLYAVPEGN